MVPGFKIIMMTSSNGNIFRVSGLLCGEFTGHRWIPHTKASDAELWCFLWSAPEPTTAQTMGTPVIWDAIALSMTSLLWCILIWKMAVYVNLELRPLEGVYIPQFYRDLSTLGIMYDEVMIWICFPPYWQFFIFHPLLVKLPITWDAIALTWCHCNAMLFYICYSAKRSRYTRIWQGCMKSFFWVSICHAQEGLFIFLYAECDTFILSCLSAAFIQSSWQ